MCKLNALHDITDIIQLCKHVVAKVTLVPYSVNLTGKRDTVGHGEVTINNAKIITDDLANCRMHTYSLCMRSDHHVFIDRTALNRYIFNNEILLW